MPKQEHNEVPKELVEALGLDALDSEEKELEQEDMLYKEIEEIDVSDARATRALIEKIKAQRTRLFASHEFSAAHLGEGIPEKEGFGMAGCNFRTLEVFLDVEHTPSGFRDILATHEAAELLFGTKLPPLDDKKPAHDIALQYEYERAAELGILDTYHTWNVGEFQKVIERYAPHASAEAIEEAKKELKQRGELFQQFKQLLEKEQHT